MKKRTKVFIGIAVVAAAGIGFTVWQNATREPVNPNLNAPTVALAKADMVKTVSASGAVKSDTTVNIYSTQAAYPVMEILVETGDAVKKGDVLARLDMSALEDDILTAQLNLRTAQVTADEEKRTNANTITTAETSLSSSQISLEQQRAATANAEEDLREAEADAEEPFDSYASDKAIEEARVSVERAEDALQTAQEDLNEALNDFDDYAYQITINEAAIQVDRRKEELATAEANLSEELEKEDEFDPYTLQLAINDAQKNYEIKQKAKVDAQQAVTDAEREYLEAQSYYNYSQQDLVNAAKTKWDTAKKTLETAQQAEDEALKQVTRAKTDLTRAEEDFEENYQETKDTKIDGLEDAVELAQKNLDDAERTHEKAVNDLERAKEDSATAMQTAYDKAQDTVFDARRAYETKLSDKERAIEDYIDANAKSVDAAQEVYENSQKQLESTANQLTTAENNLEQAESKQSTAETTVELRQISLDALTDTLEDAEIIATEDGIITELNAKVGAAPSGILFVIEDAQDLYVSANIKEYSLSAVAVGQKAYVTTDATGDEIFDAEVSYISPKAVSAAGSTSVEFEIRAKFSGGDAVKIGMNAFLNVVTETKESVYSVPLSAIVTDERGSFVYSPNGAERTEIPVTVGIKTTTQGEISGEGLNDGLTVLTQPTELPTSNFPSGMMFGG